MKAEEKAKELIKKFKNMHLGSGGIGMNENQVRECALIACNLALNIWNDMECDDDNCNMYSYDRCKYWEKVINHVKQQ